MNTARAFVRRDFADTLVALSTPRRGTNDDDPVEQAARADATDWTLLRLVLCVAAATLVLALAVGLLG